MVLNYENILKDEMFVFKCIFHDCTTTINILLKLGKEKDICEVILL